MLPDGRIWNGLRGLRKDNTGYDLKQLFIGAEGTLGIVTAAVLKLYAPLRARACAWVAIESVDAAIALLEHCRSACGDGLTSFELISRSQLEVVYEQVPGTRDPLDGNSPWALLLELADSASDAPLQATLETVIGEALEAGLAVDAVLAASETQSNALWHLRHIVSEANVRCGTSVTHDISLPISKIPECLAGTEARLLDAGLVAGARFLYVGHVGDGNIHSIVLFPHDVWSRVGNKDALISQIGKIVNDTAVSFGGSISAEHGIGRAHRDELVHYKSDVEFDLMKAVKRAFDPEGRMNPGKLF